MQPRQQRAGALRLPDQLLLNIIGLGLIAGLLAVLALIVFGSSLPNDDAVVDPLAAGIDPEPTAQVVMTERTTIVVPPAEPTAGPTRPYVQATFSERDLLLQGSVSSAELAASLERAAELVYSPFVRSELVVDERLPPQPWLGVSPQAIMLLQMISDGTMLIAEGRISVAGRAASAEEVDELEQFLAEGTGLPITIDDIEITGRRPAIYVITATDGQVVLSGALPTEEIRNGLAATARAVYGDEHVVDASVVDEMVDPTLWMYTPEPLLATLSAFPEYEIRLNGGSFSASLSGGATFSPGSAEITPTFAQILNFGIVTMARDPAMSMTIEGHTDSQGTDEDNQQLSQRRADAVATYVTAGGINPTRLHAIGMGERVPVAPNDTSEGRARNRRIEFVLESTS